MSTERINGIKINMNVCTQDELETMRGHRAAELEEVKTDIFIIDDTLYRRFGRTAVGPGLDQPCEREFDLNVVNES